MPPVIYDPPNLGSTGGGSWIFVNANAHPGHGAVNFTQWKITVTTLPNNNGTLKTETAYDANPIDNKTVTGLPADNKYYYAQIVYDYNGSTYVGASNKFKSQP